MGYLRIPDFNFYQAADFYCLTRQIRKLNEKGAELLVIDLMHNPGGMFNCLMTAISLLIDKPIKNLTQWSTVSPEIAGVMELKTLLSDPDQIEMMRKELKNSVPGMDGEYLEKSLLNYADFILDQSSKGLKISEPFPIAGIEEILPHPKTRFKGPLLVLTDALDFSCADFFAALLKDAGRATLFGSKTAGAGGIVSFNLLLSNRLGITALTTTASVVQRQNGELIEGIGVAPDIEYHISPEDYLQNFEPMRQRILDVIEKMLSQKN